MAWTTPVEWSTIAIPSKDDLNTHIRDNFNETAPAKVTTKGDILAGLAANSIGRLAVGSNDQVLIADSAQTEGVKWGAIPAANHSHTQAEAANASTQSDSLSTDASYTLRYYIAAGIGTAYANAIQKATTPGGSDRMTVLFGHAGIRNQDTTGGTNALEIRTDSVQVAEVTQSSGSIDGRVDDLVLAFSSQGLSVASHTHEVRTKSSAGVHDLVIHGITVVEVYLT